MKKTWRYRRLSVVAVMALSLVLAAVPVAAEDDVQGDEIEPATVTSSGDGLSIEFQTIRCPEYGSVRGNSGEGGVDATDGRFRDYGPTVDEFPIEILDPAPPPCSVDDSFVDFELSIGGAVGADPATLSSADSVFDPETGTSTTTTGALFPGANRPDSPHTLDLAIRTASPLPPDTLFGALQCYRDGKNPDNLELIEVPADVDSVACVLFLVDDPVETDEDEDDTGGPVFVAPDTRVLGDRQVLAERDGQTVTASGPSTGDIRVVFGADEDAAIDGIVTAACDVLVEDAAGPLRLAPNVVVIDPTGFAPGDEIEVTSLIPAADVERVADWSTIPTGELLVGDVPGDAAFVTAEQITDRLAQIRANRSLPAEPASDAIWRDRILAGTATIGDARTAISAKAAFWSAGAYGVCFAGEKPDVGSLTGLPPLDGTPLYGPVLLSVCTDETAAPCIDERTKDADGNVTVAYRIPAEDPWMR